MNRFCSNKLGWLKRLSGMKTSFEHLLDFGPFFPQGICVLVFFVCFKPEDQPDLGPTR